ncbi:hypothetical protein PV343_15560 [Streptomyces sp. WI03-4A]|uniref:hypothetical protein n=1 Tax=Streptomyces sp. WI03-4A TaxID=3028706 RepID=UPI0029A2C1DB|nr:hypothetical protein [Streptomyces sp. WI03-4A]MDX2593647.1 hypothetical protein [Streptomyces sp. WI03-4A]
MSRLSFEKRRAQQPAGHPSAVHVRVSGEGGASVGGTVLAAAPGEDIQQAVLNHLQRLAISLGAPIRATIHDDRAGCVVPLEVFADGSSRMAGAPVRVAPGTSTASTGAAASTTGTGVASSATGSPPEPTGQFGPPPAWPEPAVDVRSAPAAVSWPEPATDSAHQPAAPPRPAPELRRVPVAAPVPAPLLDPAPAPAGSATPTPARGFDAVAEEVLGDEPVTETAEGAELLAEPLARINEAVRDGRIEAAAELADRTVTEASGVLGPHHPEVLHLGELTAYIAYLAGDPVRSFHRCLDLARLRRRAGDAEAAYGNVQSAATAWRAVRDPQEGLRLGRELIELWTELEAEPGPAAEDPDPLRSARARMVRLTDRAARAERA